MIPGIPLPARGLRSRSDAEADASAIACRTPSQPPPTAPYRGSAELSAFKQAVTETLVRQEWLEDLLSEDMDQ